MAVGRPVTGAIERGKGNAVSETTTSDAVSFPVESEPAPSAAPPTGSAPSAVCRPPAGLAERRVRSLLARADVRVDGGRPWDISVHDRRFYGAVLRRGITGAGDAYADGWWDCEAIDELLARVVAADLPAAVGLMPHALLTFIRHRILNLQTPRRAHVNGRAHYDRGNRLFEAMLDSRLTYSCGYWSAGARSLEEAQEAKLDLICRKLKLRPGQRVLDIGCGWGSFVRFAAERYGASCVGITVSTEQAEYARRCCADLPVEIELMDYRDLRGRYDRVVSIGMLEHVGPKNYATFARTVDNVLEDDGLALLHFFASPRSFPNLRDTEVDWFERNIFPGLVIPSLAQIGAAIDGRFVLEDLHNFGADYHPTLLAWWRNFDEAWPTLRVQCGYDERFRRMWKFYLLAAAGAFLCRKYQVWQLVLSQRGVRGGYVGIR